MRHVRMAIAWLFSSIKLCIKKCFGCRIRFKFIHLMSPCAHFYTERKGRISVGVKTGVRPNTEIKANGGDISIGNNCFINRNCLIVSHKKIHIEDNVTIGPNTVIYDHDHSNTEGGFVSQEVEIGKNTWIGAGCIILKGVHIGNNSIIGAGTIIVDNVPENSVVYQKRDTTIKTKE